METTIMSETGTTCTGCGKPTAREIGGRRVCLECEMKDLAAHCARRPGLVIRDVLEAYLGRPATDEEAEAFTRHYLEAAQPTNE